MRRKENREKGRLTAGARIGGQLVREKWGEAVWKWHGPRAELGQANGCWAGARGERSWLARLGRTGGGGKLGQREGLGGLGWLEVWV